MEANRSRARWTYAEFARLPREGSARYEIIDGELGEVLPSQLDVRVADILP